MLPVLKLYSGNLLLKNLHDERVAGKSERLKMAKQQLERDLEKEKRYILISPWKGTLESTNQDPRVLANHKLVAKLAVRARKSDESIESFHDTLVRTAPRRKQIQIANLTPLAIEEALERKEAEEERALVAISVPKTGLANVAFWNKLKQELKGILEMLQENALIPDPSLLSPEELLRKKGVVYEMSPKWDGKPPRYLFNDTKTICIREWAKELSSKLNGEGISENAFKKYIKTMRKILKDDLMKERLVNVSLPAGVLPGIGSQNCGGPVIGPDGNTFNLTTLALCRYGVEHGSSERQNVWISSFVQHTIAGHMIEWLSFYDQPPSPDSWKEKLALIVEASLIDEEEIHQFATRVKDDEALLVWQQKQKLQKKLNQEAELKAAERCLNTFTLHAKAQKQQEEEALKEEAHHLAKRIEAMASDAFKGFNTEIEAAHHEGKASLNGLEEKEQIRNQLSLEKMKQFEELFAGHVRSERLQKDTLKEDIKKSAAGISNILPANAGPASESPYVVDIARIGSEMAKVMCGAFKDIDRDIDRVFDQNHARIDAVDDAGRASLQQIDEEVAILQEILRKLKLLLERMKRDLRLLNQWLNKTKRELKVLKLDSQHYSRHLQKSVKENRVSY